MNNKFSIFPTAFIKQCVETYTTNHNKKPKILCANEDDIYNWALTNTIVAAKQFELTIVPGEYLRRGEIDLALEIKEEIK